MGKFDHICELMGLENYSQWQKQMTLALRRKELWSHYSSSTNLSDLANFASTKPIIADRKTPTDVEKKVFLSWLARDSQAKALIDCKISSIIGNLFDESQMAREQWESLAQHYSCKDFLFQYELWTRVRLEKLKDAEDALCYLGVFKDARCRFVEMGVIYIYLQRINFWPPLRSTTRHQMGDLPRILTQQTFQWIIVFHRLLVHLSSLYFHVQRCHQGASREGECNRGTSQAIWPRFRICQPCHLA